MKKYEYRVLPFATVAALASPLVDRDSYISDDAEARAFANALKDGFRWVRTDFATHAVFEKEVETHVP